MRLLLIRHGQTPSNVKGLLDTGAPGPGLTALGGRQAERIPSALDEYRIDRIVASSLVRTQLTAAPLAASRDLEVSVVDGLEEIGAGSMELSSDAADISCYLETAFAWATGDLGRAMPGGPDGHDFFARYDAAIGGIGSLGDETVAVVSHGAAIRVWASARCANIASQYGADHELDNTGLVEMVGTPAGGWELVRWVEHPIGGVEYTDTSAEDPTGETLEAARESDPTTVAPA